jgi:PAS domain S-box-containing protein
LLFTDNAVLKASSGHLSRSGSTETERLGLLYGLVPRSVAISIAISGLTALALWEQADHATLLAWLAAATLVSGARGALYVFFRRAAIAASKTAVWENLFTAGAGLMGIVWTALVLIGPLSMTYRIFVVFVVGGMAMGAAGILGASKKAFLCFVIPMLVAQIGELFWIGGNVFALMGAIFSFGLFSAYSEFRRALLLALEAWMNMEQLHGEQRLIFDTATVGILFIRDRKIVDCNQRMADIVGFVRDELIGSSTRAFYPSEQSWNDFGKRAYDALGEGKTFRDELVIRKKTGDQITCDVSSNSLVPSQPEQGIITTVNDISAKKHAEHDLRKALQEQYAIFDNAVVGIAYLHGKKIENCNSRFARIFGYQREEVIGGSARVLHLSQESWELW